MKKYGVHVVFMLAVLVCLFWIYSGMKEEAPKQNTMEGMDHSTMMPSSATSERGTASSGRDIADQDGAVKGYLDAAQTLAEVYKFTNGGSYAGLCEGSDSMYTLEGESGGILKYIKMVGATEVFCSTSESAYLVEAKMPKNGLFYCIDNHNEPIAQAQTKEGSITCK